MGKPICSTPLRENTALQLLSWLISSRHAPPCRLQHRSVWIAKSRPDWSKETKHFAYQHKPNSRRIPNP
jgi:hypothetical protein